MSSLLRPTCKTPHRTLTEVLDLSPGHREIPKTGQCECHLSVSRDDHRVDIISSVSGKEKQFYSMEFFTNTSNTIAFEVNHPPADLRTAAFFMFSL